MSMRLVWQRCLASTGALCLIALAGCVFGNREPEVRAAFAEYRRALQARDVGALAELVVAEKTPELAPGPNTEALVQMVSQFAPPDPEITAVEIDGPQATLKLRAALEGQPMSGTARLLRQGGRWKLDREEWSIEMTASIFAPEIASRLGPAAENPLEPGLLVEAHDGGVTRLAFTPNGQHLVSIGYGDNAIRVWDLESETLASEASSEHRPVDMALTPDGSRMVVADAYGWVTLWPLEAGRIGAPDRLPENGGHLTRLAVNRDGTLAATTSWDGPVCLWDLSHKRQAQRLSKKDRERGVAFSPTSPLVVSGSNENTFTVWDLESRRLGARKRVRIPKVADTSDVWSVAISPNGRYLVTGHMDASITVWDLPARKQLHNFYVRDAATRAVGFSPDGSLFATAQQDGRIHFWEPQSARRLGELRGHESAVEAIAFAPGGRYLFASGGEDGRIVLWR